jgi:hypothetical protein
MTHDILAVQRAQWHRQRESFRAKLEELINREGMEAGSNTPDYILAEYLMACLKAFDDAAYARSRWYSRAGVEMLGRTKL